MVIVLIFTIITNKFRSNKKIYKKHKGLQMMSQGDAGLEDSDFFVVR